MQTYKYVKKIDLLPIDIIEIIYTYSQNFMNFIHLNNHWQKTITELVVTKYYDKISKKSLKKFVTKFYRGIGFINYDFYYCLDKYLHFTYDFLIDYQCVINITDYFNTLIDRDNKHINHINHNYKIPKHYAKYFLHKLPNIFYFLCQYNYDELDYIFDKNINVTMWRYRYAYANMLEYCLDHSTSYEIDWNDVSLYRMITPELVQKYKDKINWGIISVLHNWSLEFMFINFRKIHWKKCFCLLGYRIYRNVDFSLGLDNSLDDLRIFKYIGDKLYEGSGRGFYVELDNTLQLCTYEPNGYKQSIYKDFDNWIKYYPSLEFYDGIPHYL